MTVTFFMLSTPSMDVRSWATTLSQEELSPAPRTGAMESISSKNMMQGAICLARLNIWRMALSLSPSHLLATSGPFTEMKLVPDSLATALAMSVFPVPGGPYRRMPFPGLMPSLS